MTTKANNAEAVQGRSVNSNAENNFNEKVAQVIYEGGLWTLLQPMVFETTLDGNASIHSELKTYGEIGRIEPINNKYYAMAVPMIGAFDSNRTESLMSHTILHMLQSTAERLNIEIPIPDGYYLIDTIKNNCYMVFVFELKEK